MILKKNQKVFIKGKTIGRSFDEVLEMTTPTKTSVPMIGSKYFGYWQRSRDDLAYGNNINVIDYKPNTGSGDYYSDKDIKPVEIDFIPEELFEI